MDRSVYGFYNEKNEASVIFIKEKSKNETKNTIKKNDNLFFGIDGDIVCLF